MGIDKGWTDRTGGKPVELEIERILPNPLQPRRHFKEERIEQLARSIKGQGIIQPLVVRSHPTLDGYYELVAGERRLRALRLLGLAAAPAIVNEIPDEALLEASLVENVQREPLTPIEEAQAYRSLLDEHGYTQEQLALRLGKDRSTIANMVRLLGLQATLHRDLEEERLSAGHGRALLSISDPARRMALRDEIVARGLSVREAERLALKERTKPKTAGVRESRPAPRDPKMEAVQENMERRLATRVTIQQNADGSGKFEITFYSLDDFNRLYELIATR